MGVIINELHVEAVGPGADGAVPDATEPPEHPSPRADEIERINRFRDDRRSRLEAR